MPMPRRVFAAGDTEMKSELEISELRNKLQVAYDEYLHEERPMRDEFIKSKLVSVSTFERPDTLYDLVRILAWVLEEEWID